MIKVLIAEDDAFLASVIMEKTGKKHEARSVPDGEQALKVLAEWKPDMLILDILMPKVDGFGVLAAMKKDAALSNIPVLVLTNLSDADNLKHAVELGAAEAVAKVDFTPQQLEEKIEAFAAEHVGKK